MTTERAKKELADVIRRPIRRPVDIHPTRSPIYVSQNLGLAALRGNQQVPSFRDALRLVDHFLLSRRSASP